MLPSTKRMTFAGVDLFEIGRQGVSRQHSTLVNSRHIPGSDRNYIDIGGRPSMRVSIPVFFDSNDEFMSFQVRVGTQSTLVYSGGTFAAILESLTTTEILPDEGQYATADFVLL